MSDTKGSVLAYPGGFIKLDALRMRIAANLANRKKV